MPRYNNPLGNFCPIRCLAGILAALALGFLASGCAHPGFYLGPDPAASASQAFFQRDWELARQKFAHLAGQTGDDKAMAAGRYGLACVAMITATDANEVVQAMASLSGMGPDQTSPLNPALVIRAMEHGIGLMARAGQDQLSAARQAAAQKDETISGLEQMVKTLKHQIAALETIDREVQEKRKNQ